jgi:Flp pilus assembly pilin Flp
MLSPLLSFLRCERGATAIEYGMICCFVFLAIVTAVQTLGATIFNDLYNKIAGAL